MAIYENDQFIIRNLEHADAPKILHAVEQNRDLLATDFPGVASGYHDLSEAQSRVDHNVTLSADSGSGFDVIVATNPENTALYGMGTCQHLGRRAIRLLGINWQAEEPGYILDAAMVAGWTVREHPSDLPVQALQTLVKTVSQPDPTRAYGGGTNFVTAALIRPDHAASQRVAEAAGMRKTGKTLSAVRVKLANVGVKGAQGLWVSEQPEPYPNN